MDHDVKGVVERTEQSLFTHFRHQLNTHWLAALEQQNTHIAGFVHPVPEAQSSSTPKIKVQKLCDPFVVEVRTLKGHLGEVVLGQGKVTFWDLAKEIHSQFPLPERCFSRLVVGDACNPRSLETQADKVMTITDHHVTIVYEELTPDLQREAELKVEMATRHRAHGWPGSGLDVDGRRYKDPDKAQVEALMDKSLDFKVHMIWMAIRHLVFGWGAGVYYNVNVVIFPPYMKSLLWMGAYLQGWKDGGETCEHSFIEFPSGLQSLTFCDRFIESLDKVHFPKSLQSLTFGEHYDTSMDKVILPGGLKSLTFGEHFDQPMDNVTLPSGLESLTFGWLFCQSMDKVSLPSTLKHLTFGGDWSQNVFGLILPEGCQCKSNAGVQERDENKPSQLSQHVQQLHYELQIPLCPEPSIFKNVIDANRS